MYMHRGLAWLVYTAVVVHGVYMEGCTGEGCTGRGTPETAKKKSRKETFPAGKETLPAGLSQLHGRLRRGTLPHEKCFQFPEIRRKRLFSAFPRDLLIIQV